MSSELFAAIKKGDGAAVERLLVGDHDLAAAVDENGVSAVLTAFYHGHPEVARILIDQHPGLNVFEAATAGDARRVEWLLDRSRVAREDRTMATAFSSDGFHPLGLAAFF